MALFRKKEESSLSRRIREIERERKTIERDLRLLNKALKKPESLQELRRPAAGAPEAPEFDRDVPAAEPAPVKPGDELFPGVPQGAEPGLGPQRPRPGPGTSDSDLNLAERERSKLEGDHRFANYIVAGNVDGIRPLRHERRVQRNRAIVMIVAVLIVLVWVVYSCSAMRNRPPAGDLPQAATSINDSPLP